MYARVGDRIVVRGTSIGGPGRDGEVIEIERLDGRPPYRVRWSDTGQQSLFFPGVDAYVDKPGAHLAAAGADPGPTSRVR